MILLPSLPLSIRINEAFKLARSIMSWDNRYIQMDIQENGNVSSDRANGVI